MSYATQRTVTRNSRQRDFGVKHRIGNGKAGRTINSKSTSSGRHKQNYVQIIPVMEARTIDDSIQMVQVGERQIKHRR